MRKLVMTALVVVASACSGATGTAQSGEAAPAAAAASERRSYDLGGFDGVSVVGPHRVTIVVGPEFSVSAEGPAETLRLTDVYVEDGQLRIEPDRDYDWDRRERWRDYEAASFRVTLPRLEAAAMIGSGVMTADRVSGESFAGSVAGSGTLDIAALAVTKASLSVAGSGDLVIRGRASRADVSIAGSGNLVARELASETASVSIAGSGDAVLTVNGEADVSIVGSGDAEIAGAARCSVSRIGSGDVTCADVERETEFSFR